MITTATPEAAQTSRIFGSKTLGDSVVNERITPRAVSKCALSNGLHWMEWACSSPSLNHAAIAPGFPRKVLDFRNEADGLSQRSFHVSAELTPKKLSTALRVATRSLAGAIAPRRTSSRT